jgi:hypothetical protein
MVVPFRVRKRSCRLAPFPQRGFRMRRSARWSTRPSRILDAGPRERAARSPTMLSMQTTSPIRRYVLLRQRSHDATMSRWSMERIAPAPRAAGRGRATASPAKVAGERA